MSYSVYAEDGLIELASVDWVGNAAPGENALVLRGAGILTGVSHGGVTITVDRSSASPSDAELAHWEDVVEAAANLTMDSSARAFSEWPPSEAQLCASPGLHSVLIAARGRDAHPDGAEHESGEQYLIVTWPVSSPIASRVRWLRSDRSRSLASAPSVRVPSVARPSYPMEAGAGAFVGSSPIRFDPESDNRA